MMSHRLHGLLAKEFAQMLRDPVIIFLIVWLYTAELVLCTTALGFDVRNLRLGLIDNDRSAVSRMLVTEMTASDSFVLTAQYDSRRAAERDMKRGGLDALVEIPPRLGARIAAGGKGQISVIVDGSNATVASRARAYLIEITGRATAALSGARAAAPAVRPSVKIWYNPDLTNTRFMALGMLAQAGFMLSVVLPAAAVVREKQLGTMEQLRVTPIRAHELFVAKVVPTVVVSLGGLFPALLITTLLGVPMKGNIASLFILDAVFLLSAVSIGVFVATITDTLQQAMLVSFFSLFPLLFLSGSITPIETMPPSLQAASQLSPLRHFIEILGALFLKGAGMAELWPHAAAMAAISALMFASAWILFRRTW